MVFSVILGNWPQGRAIHQQGRVGVFIGDAWLIGRGLEERRKTVGRWSREQGSGRSQMEKKTKKKIRR